MKTNQTHRESVVNHRWLFVKQTSHRPARSVGLPFRKITILVPKIKLSSSSGECDFSPELILEMTRDHTDRLLKMTFIVEGKNGAKASTSALRDKNWNFGAIILAYNL